MTTPTGQVATGPYSATLLQRALSGSPESWKTQLRCKTLCEGHLPVTAVPEIGNINHQCES